MLFKRKKIVGLILIVSIFVFIISLIFLILGDELAIMFNVIGIRVATLFVAFASFCSTSAFSYLIYLHNRTVSKANDDANKRAELFREFQFASSNYSIVEFNDGMAIYDESTRYIDKFVRNKNLQFHMIDENINESDVLENPNNYKYFSIRLAYRVAEGKIVAKIAFRKLKFERNGNSYRFLTSRSFEDTRTFLIYNETTKSNNAIINLIIDKDSDFFDSSKINYFSKIKINLTITSLLGVEVNGITELYFTNPDKNQEGMNLYKINSSNFTISEMPKVTHMIV